MQDIIENQLNEVHNSFTRLAKDDSTLRNIENVTKMIVSSINSGGKVMVCGNGGSAADAQHFVAEFIGRFYFDRQPLPAIALTTDTSIITCVANDYSYEDIFARQVTALGKKNDVLIGISTSGSSGNVSKAVESAKDVGCKTVLLTGNSEGSINSMCDVIVAVPSGDTPRIQEMHLFVEHMICELVESALGHRVV
ncbi:D-sedoheptulose 7-phosphate isomerase [Pseudomonadales bacterium]|nr:D-sedoheptulose 7-phosphate isomerase [Pseudomonadales bacterium]